MFKFILLCTVAALCAARSLNDGKVQPAAVANDAVMAKPEKTGPIQPKDAIAVEDMAAESDLAAAIDSISEDIIDSDKTRLLLFRTTSTTSTTTPLPTMQKIDLLLTLNSVASAGTK